MMDDDFDEYDDDPRAGAEFDDDEAPSPDESFDVDQTTEGQFDDSELDPEHTEDHEEVFEEDGDEEMHDEMHDRGTDPRNALGDHV